MSEDRIAVLAKIDIPALENLRDTYESNGDHRGVADVRAALERHDSAAQTGELANSGRLFKHRHVDPENGRVTHTFTGDIAAWMAPFMTGATVGRISPELLDEARSGRLETVRLRHGERVQIVKG